MADKLLMETGDALLMENGSDALLLEQGDGVTATVKTAPQLLASRLAAYSKRINPRYLRGRIHRRGR